MSSASDEIRYPLAGVIANGFPTSFYASDQPPIIADPWENKEPQKGLIIAWQHNPYDRVPHTVQHEKQYALIIDRPNEKFYVCRRCVGDNYLRTCDGNTELVVTMACPLHYVCHATNWLCCSWRLPMALHISPIMDDRVWYPPGPKIFSFWTADNEDTPTAHLSFAKILRNRIITAPQNGESLEIKYHHEHADDCIWGKQPAVKVQHGARRLTGGMGLAKSLYFKQCGGGMWNALGEKLAD